MIDARISMRRTSSRRSTS